MADREHQKIVRSGVAAWNSWRALGHELPPDLSDMDLQDASLIGANLFRANLSGSSLKLAQLAGADLRESNLTGADFSGANLQHADLSRALASCTNMCGTNLENAKFNFATLDRVDLSGAPMRGTDFGKSYIRYSRFYGADLNGANFGDATMDATVFAEMDLKGARGLEAINHTGPSILDIRVAMRSGRLPLAFLRGCGFPDNVIEYLPSLSNEPIQFYSCFISYSSKDQAFAERIHADLQDRGVRCWFAPHKLRAGMKVHEQIDEAIRVYDRLLILLSENSMNSEWVKTEIAKARKREIRENRRILFPICLVPFIRLRDWECFDVDSGKDSATEIREYYIPDFSNWQNLDAYTRALGRLIRDLKPDIGV